MNIHPTIDSVKTQTVFREYLFTSHADDYNQLINPPALVGAEV